MFVSSYFPAEGKMVEEGIMSSMTSRDEACDVTTTGRELRMWLHDS